MKSLVLFTFIFTICLSASSEEWKSRTIYQIITDRFSKTDDDRTPCGDLSKYCGGTWKGIQNKLDYIQGMGFDAIWISPIPVNTPNDYHGYAAVDWENVNPKFGTENDLKNLVDECHNRGIYVMLDVVANHVGIVQNISTIIPFNKAKHYHSCGGCPQYCTINDYNNQTQMELCRTFGLPDLDQNNAYVKKYLNSWVKKQISHFGFDGIRIDTVGLVQKDFWYDYVNSAGVYAIGEVLNGLTADPNYFKAYIHPLGPLPGLLSYPLFWYLRDSFAKNQSMKLIGWGLYQYRQNLADVNVLGNFIDNHDQQTFFSVNSDVTLYKAALAVVLFAPGIPIIYQTSEQGYIGGEDPLNRRPLWESNFNTNHELYKYISQLVQWRKSSKIWQYDLQDVFSSDNLFVFKRGSVVVAVTNAGSKGGNVVQEVTGHPYSDGQKVCNLLWGQIDCQTIKNGKLLVYLSNGETKIYNSA